MSHIASIDIELKDIEALKEACKRLNIKFENVENYKFYDGTRKSGLAIHLPNSKYPMVLDNNGKAYFDNYNGRWGDLAELDKVKDHYGLELTKRQAKVKGYTFYERKTQDGKIQLVVNV
jgi:hypothetical protein